MKKPVLSLSLALAASFAASCGPKQSTQLPSEPAAPETPGVAAGEQPAPALAARPKFENPGGMWMPQQLVEQAPLLEQLGLEIDPAGLSDPLKAPLAAVVSLGGCSASFVSPRGLVITNHHCVQGALQYNSTPEDNLIENGFHARTMADEKSAGPGAKLWVALSYKDVTADMNDGLDAITDDLARDKAHDDRYKALLAACEKDRPAIRCKVSSFFGGAQWFLIEQFEIRDVRLVYAPHRGIGNFGGEIDNWRWPRHTGDYSFYRAYVGKDGQPADYSPDNVPYQPPHYLKVAKAPLSEGDLVLVAGYPGGTERLKTAYEAAEAAEWEIPRFIAKAEQILAMLEVVTKDRADLKIKAEGTVRGLNNSLTNQKGTLEALVKGGLVEKRQQQDEALFAWIDADPARKQKYRPAIDKMLGIYEEEKATREEEAAFGELLGGSKLFGVAVTIVRMAEERGKPDAEREPGFQERDWKRTEQGLVAMDKRYARELDRATWKLYLGRVLALPAADQPREAMAILFGKGKLDDKAVEKFLDKMYATTTLESAETRVALYKTATTAQLKKSKDPMIQLALKVRPLQKAREDKNKRLGGAMILLRPVYVTALREWRGGMLAPDANGTLRVTYGTVMGPPDGGAGFTTGSELLKKVGEEPFDAPVGLVQAIQKGNFGRYAASPLGELPVNFMSDLDITGGNSGSATINARGELVGLAFDGTYESVASDWLFMEKVTRTIHVDIRYVLWIMDAVDGADDLLVEMGVNPSL